ncbi:phosphatidate cytidylyltransferase [Mitosporidium daphniae]
MSESPLCEPASLVSRRRSATKLHATPPEDGLEKRKPIPAPVAVTPRSWKNFLVRSLWSIPMIVGFTAILWSGHIFVILMVIIMQTVIFKEVIDLVREPWPNNRLPWFRTISWYFLITTNYFLYGEVLIKYFKRVWILDAFLLPLANHHRFISFSLYMMGLIAFVLNLKNGCYKFQFGLFAWTHMTLLLVTFQSHLVIINIVEGLIWFILPVCLVICNDISAYLFGFFFGRTPLIKISPKKTWEGLIGALFATIIFGFFLAGWLAPYTYLTLPMPSPAFKNRTTGASSATFEFKPFKLPPFISSLRKHLQFLTPWGSNKTEDYSTINVAPIQLHAIVFAIFSSVIAPFGGFFASGVKRAFKMKDFADSIPGHGGLTDRMDCQLLMGIFAYLYTASFVFRSSVYQNESSAVVSLEFILDAIIHNLSPEEQLDLFHSIKTYLQEQQLLPSLHL